MIKIIFFDIDGTLLPLGKKELSKKNEYALNELQKQGILICLSSGRGNTSLPKFRNFHADVFATFNGALCYNKSNKIIYKKILDKSDIRQVIKNANKLNRCLSMNNDRKLVANGLDKDLKEYFAIGHEKAKKVNNFNSFIKSDVYKIMLSCSMSERKQIIKDTKNIKIEAWWDKAIDLVHIDSGKGKAIKEILKFYKIKRNEAIAFGDGANDVEMFKEVKTSVAMGNALGDVKKKATNICKDVNSDGVYHYLVNNKIIKKL